MIYKQNYLNSLPDSLFKNPTSEYRGTPFWAWNCALDKNELLRQIEVFKEMGLGGFHMHVRTGLETEYLSEEFMRLIRACVDKAKEEKMLAWLYDEDRWPSGAAGGIVTKDERFRARHLLFTTRPYDGTVGFTDDSSSRGTRSENGRLLACYDVSLDENGYLASYKTIGADEAAKGTKWYAYLEISGSNPWYNNQSYVNTLDKKAIERFIEVTHEKYKEYVGDEFGETVPAIFTDEPQFTRKSRLNNSTDTHDVIMPWTDDFPDTYFETYNQDIMEKLPEIFWDLPGGAVSTARYRYHDHIAERFSSAFADTCGAWCRKNGIALTGHMMEEPTLDSQAAALGEAMRSYRGFDLPGIDMLCSNKEYTTAKQAQSAAHQFGREGVLSELYGVTDWNFDFRGHKLNGDWQAALGVTVRVQHLSWVSMAGEAKRDYPASISYQSPWYKKYSCIEDHFARVNTAMTRGTPVVRVGVIHPVESYWLHWGPNDKSGLMRRELDEKFQNLTKWLLFGSVDFDFISESLLPEQCGEGGAPLRVGEMKYDVVIVPDCETLRSSTLDRLEKFQAEGGKLIFMGSAPKLQNAEPSERGSELCGRSTLIPFTRADILSELEPYRTLSIRLADGYLPDGLVHQIRDDGDSLWLFVANSFDPYNKFVTRSKDIKITLEGEFSPALYDTMSGEIKPICFEYINGKTVISARLYEYDSLLLRLYKGRGECAYTAPEERERKPIPIPAEVGYTLDEPNVLLLDTARFALDGGDFSEYEEELLRADNICREQLSWPKRGSAVVQPWVIDEPKTEHTISLKFKIDSTLDISGAMLALEDAEKADIHLNGEKVKSEITGWYVDKSIKTVALPDIRKGENILDITLPFGRRTNVEWCYLLGNFGVEVRGKVKKLIPLAEKLAFGNIINQGLPFYGGNITYHLDINSDGGDLLINIPHYEGTLTEVFLDGESRGEVIFPPYCLRISEVAAGTHRLDIKLYTHRRNAFGTVHLADCNYHWIGPNSWRTQGCEWCYEYVLVPIGIQSSPLVYNEK